MSYDLAVWDGPRPADDRDAAAAFEALFSRYLEGGEATAPTAKVREFAAAVAEPWADVEDSDETPWAAGPPGKGSASGPIVYLAVARSRSGEVVAHAVALAVELGLNCFDPQTGHLHD